MIDEREKYKNDIEGHHYVLLRILKIFDKICRENNIEYWITDGTLLGAMRHKGFIPWDDDIDICIKKEDENKIKKILKKNLPQDLFLQTPESDEMAKKELFKLEKNGDIKFNFFKIRDRYSSTEQEKKVSYQNGICIDIFPMGEITSNFFIDKIMKKIPTHDIDWRNKKKYLKNVLKIFAYILVRLLNKNSFTEFKRKVYFFLKKEKNDGLIYMNGEQWWHIYKKEWIFPLKEIEFEGYKFMCPNNPEEYLKSYYGNYMVIPPIEKRQVHYLNVDLFNSNNHLESLKWSERRKDEE
ncbi:LicD family protein [Cetobacterium sp.]|uniref:LicD family protein n=1 Tax=Cetobacterium sp. TaxID=2071632 RepID=UPI003EE4A07C